MTRRHVKSPSLTVRFHLLVLGAALMALVGIPFAVFAARGGLDAVAVANESSGKRPSAWAFETYAGSTTPFQVTPASKDCVEISVRNETDTDGCLFSVDGSAGATCPALGAGYCGTITAGMDVSLIKAAGASGPFTSRYPQNYSGPKATSEILLCFASSSAPTTGLVYVACLKG